jgi:UDP-glucose 4-epimerase
MTLTRVLVTGGTGVIGAWVVRGFAERGITPIVFSRGTADHIGQAINGDIAERVVHVHGDLLDPAGVQDAVREHRPQAVVHMASAKPWQIERPFVARSQPRQALEQIAVATLNVLDAAVGGDVGRVVYASSKAVYDHIRGDYGPPAYRPLPEDYRQRPHMLYGVGKVAAEHLGNYYADQYGLEFTAIRFSSSFGPLKRGPASLESWLLDAAAGRPVRIRPYLDGQRDDHVYNKDVARAFVLATLAERLPHRAYNIGMGIGVNHKDLARAIRRLFPDSPISFLPEAELRVAGPSITDRARCVMDISRAGKDFGYRPEFPTLESAFADFLVEERRLHQATNR